MKTIILAAGKGVRMRSLTRDRPKPLIPVLGKPFLSYLLRNLEKANLTDLAFVVGYKGEMITSFLDEMGIKADIIKQEEQRGTGHAIGLAENLVKDSNFIVLCGDNLYSVHDLEQIQINSSLNYVTVKDMKHSKEYGIVIEKDGYLRNIIEKPEKPVGNLVNIGLYKFTPDIFSALRGIKPSPRGEIEVTDAIRILGEKNRVKVLHSKGEWFDLVEEKDVERINYFLSKNIRD